MGDGYYFTAFATAPLEQLRHYNLDTESLYESSAVSGVPQLAHSASSPDPEDLAVVPPWRKTEHEEPEL